MTAAADGLTVTHETRPDGRPVTTFTLTFADMPQMYGHVTVAIWPDDHREAFMAMTRTAFPFAELARFQMLIEAMAAEARRLEGKE